MSKPTTQAPTVPFRGHRTHSNGSIRSHFSQAAHIEWAHLKALKRAIDYAMSEAERVTAERAYMGAQHGYAMRKERFDLHTIHTQLRRLRERGDHVGAERTLEAIERMQGRHRIAAELRATERQTFAGICAKDSLGVGHHDCPVISDESAAPFTTEISVINATAGKEVQP